MFEICNNIVENLIIAIFICACLQIKEKKNIFIMITVFINTNISTILTSLNIIGLTQTLIIQFVFCYTLYRIRKEFHFQDIIVSFYCNILLFMSVYFSVIFLGFVANTNPMGVYDNNILFFINVVFSKSTFILLCFISYKKRYIPLLDLQDKRLNIVFIFELLVIMIMAFYFVQTILTSNYNAVSNLIYLCFILLFVTFYVFVNEYMALKNKLYKQEINQQKEKYLNENIKNLKRIKNDIRNTEHRINYILQLVEYDIEKEDYEQAKQKIQHNKELMYKIEPALHTGNELFDFMINMEVKQMFIKGKRVKICSFISVNDVYNQFDMWNSIIEIIQIVASNIDFIELYLSETDNNIFEVKMFFECNSKNKEIILTQLENYQKFDLNIQNMDYMIIARYRKRLYDND